MEIKMVYCPNGHYFNAAKHVVCPECGQPAQAEGVTMPVPGCDHTIAPGDIGNATIPGGSATRPVNESVVTGGSLFPETSALVDPQENGMEPVVGWLVCISGASHGKSFELHNGLNYIGRQVGTVLIPDDTKISREKDSCVAFDEQDGCFYFGPSDGKNMVRVNNKVVVNTVEIHDRDVLSVGASKLLFVALCNEHFSWESDKAHE